MQRSIVCIGMANNVNLTATGYKRMRFTESNRNFVISHVIVVANGAIGAILDPAYIAISRDTNGAFNFVDYLGPQQLGGGMSTGEVAVLTNISLWLEPIPPYSDMYARVTTAANMGSGACAADIYVYGFYINVN